MFLAWLKNTAPHTFQPQADLIVPEFLPEAEIQFGRGFDYDLQSDVADIQLHLGVGFCPKPSEAQVLCSVIGTYPVLTSLYSLTRRTPR
jgi:hypothetical protein